MAIGGLLVLRSDARALYDGLTSGSGLAMVVVSALAGAATLALVWTERYGLARVTSALAVVAIVVGWALAQNPYLLPPDLTLDAAAAADATLQATIIVVAAGNAHSRPVAVVPVPARAAGPAGPELRAARPALPHMIRRSRSPASSLGVLLMVVVDLIWLGVPLLFAFIVLGVFAVADPAFLADDVDGDAIVTALGTLPISRFEFTGDPADTPHIGPTAQAFNTAFGVGAGRTTSRRAIRRASRSRRPRSWRSASPTSPARRGRRARRARRATPGPRAPTRARRTGWPPR